MASQCDVACILLVACAIKKKQQKKRSVNRTKWTKSWLLKRNLLSHISLLEDLKFEKQDWFNYLRMDEDTYLHLLKLVSPLIQRQDTCMRQSISCHERLTATLRFLATGRSYEDLKFSTIISPQALGTIIPETCSAIWQVLKKDFLKFPQSEHDWRNIAKQFENRWNFPHCLGSVDGKHVHIVPPAGSGSYFFNYKGTHSMVLMAIANANYEFIMVDFGINGRISDGGVLEYTRFYHKLSNDELRIPRAEKVDTGNDELPYVFVGDEPFSLRPDFLKPFNQRDLTNETRIFNYRLSRARRIIENVFGILAARFRIFHTAIAVQPDNIIKIVLCCCILHNFLRKTNTSTYIRPEDLDVVDFGKLIDIESGHNRNSARDAKAVREKFVKYFNNEGSTDWQAQYIM